MILPLGQRGVTRATALRLRRELLFQQFQALFRVFLAARDFLAGQLTTGDRIKPLDADGNFTISNTTDFQLMHAGKGRNLREGKRGIIHKPDGGGFRQQRNVGHDRAPQGIFVTRFENRRSGRFTVFGELLTSYISEDEP